MKMALIGGGGVRTVFFCQSLAKYAEKAGIDELRLMDTDAEKLHIFGNIAKYAVRETEYLNIVLTNSVEDAVKDVDYVVTAIRVGGDEGRVKDERTALDLGVIGQETTGAGGFSYALRTIPVMKEYMRIINEKSNHAMVFNFTNPAGLVTQALYDAGFDNTIGICDNATGVKIELAKALEVNASELFIRLYGLNHLTWADQIRLNGTDIFETLMANEDFIGHYHDFLYYDRDLIRQIHAIPNGYLYYYYHRERALNNILKAPMTRGETILKLNREMLERLREVDVEKNPQEAFRIYNETMDARNDAYMSVELGGQHVKRIPLDLEHLGINGIHENSGKIELLEGYAGVALNYIDAKKNNLPIDLAINVPNNGAIDFMKDDDIIEITCNVDAQGAKPVKITEVPEANRLLMQQVKLYERRTVQAVKEKSLELAYMALMAHPLVGSYSLAKQLMQDYQKVHREYLGDWK